MVIRLAGSLYTGFQLNSLTNCAMRYNDQSSSHKHNTVVVKLEIVKLMNKYIFVILLVFLSMGCTRTKEVNYDFEYLGQKKPEQKPEIFAPGIISTAFHEGRITFSSDMKECFFYTVYQSNDSSYKWATLYTSFEDEKWMFPEIAYFSGIYNDHAPCLHPNGKVLVYQTDRPIVEYECKDKWNFWWVKKVDGEWSEPQPMSQIINGHGNVFGPSIAANGNLYFTREFEDGSTKIMLSRFENSAYQEPEVLPNTINSVRSQFDAAIAPDESYIIVPVYGRNDAIGSTDYYISFKNDKNQWSELVNLGQEINSENVESGPYITSDGKLFFFQSYGLMSDTVKNDDPITYKDIHKMLKSSDIYWVSTEYFSKYKE